MGTAPTGYQTPKTNWAAGNIPTASDFNRIESNIQAVEEGSRTIDPAQAPTGNSGSLRQFLDWLANRIKAITGKTNWYDTPDITLATLAQHKSRHATGGADALTPADIGAAAASDLAAHLADYAPHGATSANTANRIVLRDALGNFSAGTITATLNGNADKVDNIHFRVYNGALQYSVDGSVWNDMILKAKAWKTVDVVLPNFNTNWQTVCDVTGKGVLTRISVYGSLGSRSTIEYLDVKVTVDGVEYTFDVSNNPYSRSLRQYDPSGYMNAVDFIHLITFDNSLKVEVRTTYGEIRVNASVDFALV